MSVATLSWIVNVGEADFEQQVIEASQERLVVVDFWAPWCGPCRALAPLLERAINDQQGAVVLAKVNIDESPSLADRFHIRGIPLVVAFRDGKPVAEFEGVRPEAFVRQFVQKLLPSEADKLAAEAEALESSDPARAEALYREVLQQDSSNESAGLGLARLLLERGQEAEALHVLGDVGPTQEAERLRAVAALRQMAGHFNSEDVLRRRVESVPANARARYELGCVLAAKGEYTEALEMLQSAAERDPKIAAQLVRNVMVKLFQVVGLQSELANDYRNKLSALLY